METKHIKAKTAVVVKRMWHNPEVQAYINDREVGAILPLNDFIRALVEEIYGDRNRLWMMSKTDFLHVAFDASDSIQQALKETTTHVV